MNEYEFKTQKELGYPNFKNEIVNILVDEYNLERDLAVNFCFNSIISYKIVEDINWSQHMTASYWATEIMNIINSKDLF